MSEQCPGERAERDEGEKQRDQQLALFEQAADEREEEIEHLFDGERPEDVPVARQISAASFENIDVKGKRRKKSATESPGFRGNDEVVKMREMQHAENN